MFPDPYISSELPRSLRGLSRTAIQVFSLLCAERLVTADTSTAPVRVPEAWLALRRVLDRVWELALAGHTDQTSASHFESAVLATLPDPEAQATTAELVWSELLTEVAQTLVYALRTFSDDVHDNATLAAKCARNANFASDPILGVTPPNLILGVDPSPSFESMERERSLQLQDVADLRSIEAVQSLPSPGQVAALRCRATVNRLRLS